MCRLYLGLLGLVSLAAAKDYTYTIHNDASIGNLEGAVHTWLSIDGPGKQVKYFSFSNAPHENPMLQRPGVSTANDDLKRRTNTETLTRSISEQQYNQLSQAMDNFYVGKPVYQLIPVSGKSYNCVTAAHHVLSSADIQLLKGIVDPITLGLKLATWKSVLKRCTSYNIFTLLSPITFPLKCVIV